MFIFCTKDQSLHVVKLGKLELTIQIQVGRKSRMLILVFNILHVCGIISHLDQIKYHR